MDFGAIADSIWKQFVTVWNAPVPFLAALIGSWLVIRWFIRGQYETRLANAASSLELANRRVEDYERKLAGASPEEAKARIDTLEGRLEELRQQHAETTPRRLTPEERRAATAVLSPFPGSRVTISYETTSYHASSLQAGLVAAFREAEWNVVTGMIMGPSNPPACGAALVVADPARLSPQQKAIQQALTQAGIEYELRAGSPGLQEVAGILLTNRF
jgi:hypothetical protein